MPKANMNDMLKRRMAATQQASELQASNEAYQQIFERGLRLELPNSVTFSWTSWYPFSQRTSAFAPIPEKS